MFLTLGLVPGLIEGYSHASYSWIPFRLHTTFPNLRVDTDTLNVRESRGGTKRRLNALMSVVC